MLCTTEEGSCVDETQGQEPVDCRGVGRVSSHFFRKKQKLLQWITSQTEGYHGVHIRDLSASWADGLAFCALVHRFAPHDIPFEELSGSSPEQCLLNLELAFSVAHARFGVAPVLVPQQVIDKVDKVAVFGYLSSLHEALKKRRATGKPPKATPKSAGSGTSRPSAVASAKKLAAIISPRRLMGGSPAAGARASPSSPGGRRAFAPSAATSGKVALLRWCQVRAAEVFPIACLTDFRNGWQNGLALCAIARSYFPAEVPFEKLSIHDHVGNVRLAFEVLERCGGVPRLLDVEDLALAKEVEPQSLMTYLSTARRILDSLEGNPLRSPPPQVSPTTRKLMFQPDVLVTPPRLDVPPPAAAAQQPSPFDVTPIQSARKPQRPARAMPHRAVPPTPQRVPERQQHEELSLTPQKAVRTPAAVSTPGDLMLEMQSPAVPVPATPLSAKRRRRNDFKSEGTTDLARLPQLTVESMSHALQQRFAANEIYSWCGDVLISLNPYRPIAGLYDAAQVKRYASHDTGVPPHLYAIGRRVLDAAALKRNQSVVISGESGAGKTEATNLLVGFLSGGANELQSKLLAASVLLEALGNAKTARNDNSSRFGKLVKLLFGSDGTQMVGARIEAYLLEVTRVTGPAQGEGNFHIFYQMCAGATAEERAQYKLQPASHFAVLKGCSALPQRADAREWTRLKDSLRRIGVAADVQQEMFRLLSAILHLGNVSFVESVSNKTGVKQVELACDGSEQATELAAELLGMAPAALRASLTRRLIKASARESIVTKPLSQAQAKEGRDTFVRVLYNKLFGMVVELANAALAPKGAEEQWVFVGLLDLFGFENFESGNHFEQMMVNYANEKMHSEFLEQVVQNELREYAEEKIAFEVKVRDNSSCVGLFEDRTRGIIAVLDDECRIENATAQSFVAKLDKEWGRSEVLSVPRLQGNKPSFTVNHYAEAVTYSTHAFRARNQHVLREDLIEAVTLGGGRPLLNRLFAGEVGASGRASKITVGRRFRASLHELSTMLHSTSVSWIRCVKPNEVQAPQKFDVRFVEKQLNYLGLIAVAQLRRDGYPIRIAFAEFCQRYGAEGSAVPPTEVEQRKVCVRLLAEFAAKGSGDKHQFVMGSTRVFLSQAVWDACEDRKEAEEQAAEARRREAQAAEAARAAAQRKREEAEAESARKKALLPRPVSALAAALPREEEELSPAATALPVAAVVRTPATVSRPALVLQSVAASLSGSLAGAQAILRGRLEENAQWCDFVLRGLQDLTGALSTVRFGRYTDVKSPDEYEPASEDAKRTLRRTLRKEEAERQLAQVLAEKEALQKELDGLRGSKSEKSRDRKRLETELEEARQELTAVKRGRVEDALKRRAAAAAAAGGKMLAVAGPVAAAPTAPREAATTPVKKAAGLLARPSPPKGRRTPRRAKAAEAEQVQRQPAAVCSACLEGVGVERVAFGDRLFHEGCFACSACGCLLGNVDQEDIASRAGLPCCLACDAATTAKPKRSGSGIKRKETAAAMQRERRDEEQKRAFKRQGTQNSLRGSPLCKLWEDNGESKSPVPANQTLYGLDAEVMERIKAKNSDHDWEQALHWVAQVTGQPIEPRNQNETAELHFWRVLRSGSLLCSLLNSLFPGTVPRINKRGVALAERENVQLYVAGCIEAGVPSHETFAVSDLYEAKYLGAVVTNLHALCRTAQCKGVECPILGVRVTHYPGKKPNSPRWEIVSNQNYHRGRP